MYTAAKERYTQMEYKRCGDSGLMLPKVSHGKRGIVIVKHGKKITISNPGTIRITKEEFYAGGNSDPRNPNLLKIFGFVNVGERAGSGVDKIMTAWEEQNWKKPIYDISLRAERVTLQLEVGQIVYIPSRSMSWSTT